MTDLRLHRLHNLLERCTQKELSPEEADELHALLRDADMQGKLAADWLSVANAFIEEHAQAEAQSEANAANYAQHDDDDEIPHPPAPHKKDIPEAQQAEVVFDRMRQHIVRHHRARMAFHGRGIRWMKFAAAAIVLIVAASITFIINGERDLLSWAPWNHSPLENTAEEEAVVYRGRKYVVLPDGSSVLLNDHATLRYEPAFGQTLREVHLEGEAYFDIQHDPEHTFIVHTGAVQTRVLGTAFNVKADPDQEEVIITVTRGKVAVGDQDSIYETILPEEQMAVNTQARTYEKRNVQTEQALAWKKDILIIREAKVSALPALLKSHYNIDLVIENPKLAACTMNATFLREEKVEEVLDLVSRMMGATYVLEGNRARIVGGMECE